jgi:hypothetical protein
MTDINAEQNEKKYLLDIVRNSRNLQDHLGYVTDYLRDKISFLEMYHHAKALPNDNGSLQRYPDYRNSIENLVTKEVPVVREYIAAVAEYIEHRVSFETVDRLAGNVIDLKIDPKISQIPEDSLFYKGDKGCTLAEMREIV